MSEINYNQPTSLSVNVSGTCIPTQTSYLWSSANSQYSSWRVWFSSPRTLAQSTVILIIAPRITEGISTKKSISNHNPWRQYRSLVLTTHPPHTHSLSPRISSFQLASPTLCLVCLTFFFSFIQNLSFCHFHPPRKFILWSLPTSPPQPTPCCSPTT